MIEIITTLASIAEVTIKIYKGTTWINEKIEEWRIVDNPGREEFKIPCLYYSLTKDIGLWRKFKLGRESYNEENRLIQDRVRLLNFYPHLSDRLLTDKRIGQAPYESIIKNIKKVKLEILKTKYTIPPALKDVYNEIHKSLIDHYRRVGIQFEPTRIVRINNIENNLVNIEQVDYTESAATNLICDLDLKNAFNKSILLENNSGVANTIREYDLSLSDKEGNLPSFKKSALGNPIGVAGIGMTNDNKLLFMHRSRSVSTYAYKFGPTSSGYVTWNDINLLKSSTLNELLIISLKREIAEELHLDVSHETSELYPLGLYREFYRAGMPQAFYCFKINLTADEVVSRMKDAQDFRECVGVFSISINKQAFSRIIASIIKSQRIGEIEIGLELQGLLVALASNGEDFLFPV